jgi:UDP-N-acetylglucosamine 1-carboxyvinyltransferase
LQKIIIEGGRKLKGEVVISGSKNAALPILVATLLTDEKCTLYNIPSLKDIQTIMAVLKDLGMEFKDMGKFYISNPPKKILSETPYDLVKTMRASVLVLGALLARLGKARVALPGGCAIGLRPINIHLNGFEKLGAKVTLADGYVTVAARKLKGAKIYLDFPSVGATENLIMASVLAEGVTTIENAACEPEVVDLANFLNKMGADIKGMGTDIIRIKGVKKLNGVEYIVIPDRIEAGTFMVAGAITGGRVTVKNVIPAHLEPLIAKLREAEVEVKVNELESSVTVNGRKKIKPVNIETMPYPGFPTDMQAQCMALMTVTEGTSIIKESVFENRFMHVAELRRMGAVVDIEGNSAVVKGVGRLDGAPVMATDLRASAALIIAGLVASGRTVVSRIYHLDRGYEKIENKLRKLGANIKRVK